MHPERDNLSDYPENLARLWRHKLLSMIRPYCWTPSDRDSVDSKAADTKVQPLTFLKPDDHRKFDELIREIQEAERQIFGIN